MTAEQAAGIAASNEWDRTQRKQWENVRKRDFLNRDSDRLLKLISDNIKSLQQPLPPAARLDPVDHKIDETYLAVHFEDTALLSTLILKKLLDARKVVDRAHRYGPILEQMDWLTKTMEAVTQRLAIVAVEQGIMTRRNAAQILGVHENTVARWLKETTISGRLYGLNDKYISLYNMIREYDPELHSKIEIAHHLADENGTAVVDELFKLLNKDSQAS